MRCALKFAELQERIREVYMPSVTDDLDGRAERALLRALDKYEDWVSFRTLSRKGNLNRAAGSSVRLNRVKLALIRAGLVEEEERGEGEEKRKTGRIRLVRGGDDEVDDR
jgi:hypothetical protein